MTRGGNATYRGLVQEAVVRVVVVVVVHLERADAEQAGEMEG
jgi:hypothetical protein